MLLFNKICSIAQVLRLLHIPWETERKLNVNKSYVHGDFYVKIQKYVFGKIQDYNIAISRQKKCQGAVS